MKTAYAALAALIFACGGAKAEEISWDECTREASANNPDIKQARLSLKAARDRRNAAFGGFLPNATGSVSASDSDSENRLYFRDMDPGYSMRLGVSQSIFSGFSTLADFKGASAAARGEEASLRQEEANLRQRLRAAFVNLLYGQENVLVQDQIAARIKDNAELVRLRYEAGNEDKGTMMRAQADARQAEYEASRAKRQLVLAQQELARELGRERAGDIAVRGEWAAGSLPEEIDVEVLAEKTPALDRAQAGLEGAKADRLGAASSFWPNVGASASVNPGWLADNERSWSVSASLSYTFFSGGSRLFRYRAARAGLERAEEALLSTRRQVRVYLQESYFNFVDSFESLAVRRQYLDASRQRAEIARVQYTNGLLGFVQWDLIENELVQAERRLIGAQRDLLLAEASWLKTLGEGFER